MKNQYYCSVHTPILGYGMLFILMTCSIAAISQEKLDVGGAVVVISQEKLDVGGAIIIKNSESFYPEEGTIRWTGTDFEGWNGYNWISLSGGAIKDIDNNTYKVVTIGTETWMAENLRVTRYNDGTAIPLVTLDATWTTASTNGTPAHTWYDNGNYGTPDYGAPEYGALYNWYAIDPLSNGNKNVCPIGWRVPSDYDWTVLIDMLDPADVDPNAIGVQSLVAGKKMKETGLGHWNSPNAGATNESGFSGLPGGIRITVGSFGDIGYNGYWWSSTESDAFNAWFRILDNDNGDVNRNDNAKGLGFSVRCLRVPN